MRMGAPTTETPATSSMGESTPLDGVAASIPSTTGDCHRSLRAPACSVGRFAPLPSPHAFDSPPPSSSSQERQTPRSCSMITAWHASWAARWMTP